MDIVFHSLFVWPVQTLVAVLYSVTNQWALNHAGVALVLLSLVVNLLILPLYLVADRWQKEEKDLLASMAPKLADIRAAFRGDERQMIQQTYYRQRGYHPFLSLRSSIGLLMQIPFFLGAYIVLSHAGGLKASTAWVIQDLAVPDGLVHLGTLYINVLPLLMTAINLVSALVYARNLRLRDHLQLYALSGLFLVLLYNSPSGLVLYWTVNNLFSLGKNVVSQMRRPGRVFHGLVLSALVLWALWYLKVEGKVSLAWAFELAAVFAAVLAAPKAWKLVVAALGTYEPSQVRLEARWFRLSSLFLFLLAGVAVPLLFVSASPADVPQGWQALGRTVLQAGALLLLLPAGLWALASSPVRRLLTWSLAGLALAAAVFGFVFPPTVTFNASFTVTDPAGLAGGGLWVETIVGVAAATAVVVLVVVFRRERWAAVALGLASVSLVLVSVATALSLPPAPPATATVAAATEVTPVFHLTRKGHNQFLVFIDGSPAASFPEMLSGVPGFRDSLEGFTWYANTLSYAPHTFQTTQAMMGGPDYTPEAINARTGIPLKQKHDDGLRALPLLMGAAGERVVLTDPWYISADGDKANALFDGIPGTKALNLHGVYTDLYFKEHPLAAEEVPALSFDNDILTRFSLFRVAPPAVRQALYDDGSWWTIATGAHLADYVSGGYPNLVWLSRLCQVDDGSDGGNFFFSEVYHENGAFDADGKLHVGSVEVPASDLDRYGDLYSVRNIYDSRAVMVQVEKWLQWLKDQGVYDNTRIMVVADHGHPLSEAKFGPHPWYRPLILFKDYGKRGPLTVDETLKTNADVPSMLTAGMAHAIPARPPGDIPLTHEGPNGLHDQRADSFVFSKTYTLRNPDSRVAANWVEVNP